MKKGEAQCCLKKTRNSVRPHFLHIPCANSVFYYNVCILLIIKNEITIKYIYYLFYIFYFIILKHRWTVISKIQSL